MSTESKHYEEEDYYNPEDQANESSGFPPMVFREGIKVRYPAKGDDDKTILYVPPAFTTKRQEDNEDWTWYRYPDDHPRAGEFTSWIRGYHVFEFVGGKLSILSPQTFDPKNKINPVQTLLDAVKSNPDWHYLAGLNVDGTKNKEKSAIKERIISPSAMRFALNGVNPNKVAEKEDNICCLYTIPRGAVAGNTRGSTSDWGLFGKLAMKARNVDDETIRKDFTRRWHWGDITRADAMMPVVIQKVANPTGGAAKIYTCVPYESGDLKPAPCIGGRYPWLNSRVRLGVSKEVFIDYDASQVIDVLQALFSGHPQILLKAFESTIPNLRENLLRATGAISESRVHQAGIGDGPKKPDESSQRYAPQAGSPPPKPPAPPKAESKADRKYWVVQGEETNELLGDAVQKLVDAGENPQMIDYEQTKPWGFPADFGFSKTPAKPAPPTPPKAPTPPKPPMPPKAPEKSTPPAKVDAPQQTTPPADIPSGSAPEESSAEPEVSVDDLTRQLSEAAGVPAATGTPPPPPGAA